MIEKVFAFLGLAVCAALLLRMALPYRQRERWDAFWRRRWWQIQALGRALQQRWRDLRSVPAARREAADAIERARHGKPTVQRDGNVIRPDSFSKPGSKKPPLH